MGKADTFFQTIHIADNNQCSHRSYSDVINTECTAIKSRFMFHACRDRKLNTSSFLRCVESLIYNLYSISILLGTQFPYLIVCNMITLICPIH